MVEERLAGRHGPARGSACSPTTHPRRMARAGRHSDPAISWVCHWRDAFTLDACFGLSIRKNLGPRDEVLLLRGHGSLAAAYALAEERARGDLLVFCHEDVFLKPGWRAGFLAAVGLVEQQDPAWGVLGAWSVTMTRTDPAEPYRTVFFGNVRDTMAHYRAGVPEDAESHQVFVRPVGAVDALLVAKPRGGPAWDPKVPGFHGAVEDVCLRAHHDRRGVWGMAVYTEHWCRPFDLEGEGYQDAKAYLLGKWRQSVLTTCGAWAYEPLG